MAASEFVQFVTAAGFQVTGTPSTVNIYDHETTVILARNTGISSAPSGDLRLGNVVTSSTAVAARKTAAAYGTCVQAFADMAARQPGAEVARRLFLQAIHDSFRLAPCNLRLLDAGCGTGRDLESFKRMGYYCEGFDPCGAFANHVAAKTSCKVHVCHSENLNLPLSFHGIFCLASLYHVPRAKLVATLQNLSKHLADNGVLLLTIPSGPPYFDHQEPDGRWVNFMAPADLVEYVGSVGDLSVLHVEANFKIYTGSWILIIACKTRADGSKR